MGPGFESPPGHHVGAKSALLRRFFMLTHKKASSARSLAPPFQIATAYAGLRFGFGCRPGGMSSKLFARSTSEQASYRLLRLFIKVRARSFCCPSFPNRNRLRWVAIWFLVQTWRHVLKTVWASHVVAKSALQPRFLCSRTKIVIHPPPLFYYQNLTMVKRTGELA